jgi:hypothetical protein
MIWSVAVKRVVSTKTASGTSNILAREGSQMSDFVYVRNQRCFEIADVLGLNGGRIGGVMDRLRLSIGSRILARSREYDADGVSRFAPRSGAQRNGPVTGRC